MLVNIRGTNGSGKSTVAKKFLQVKPYIELYGALGPRRPEAYKVWLTGRWLYIIGPYQSATGGVDALGVGGSDLVRMLRRYNELGHVLFEGVVISTYHGAVGEFLQEHKDTARVLYLDTTLQVCLAGIAARGGTNTKNVEAKIKMIERTKMRFDEIGVPTQIASREEAFEVVTGWLK